MFIFLYSKLEDKYSAPKYSKHSLGTVWLTFLLKKLLICQVYSQIFEIIHSFKNSPTLIPEYRQNILFVIILFLFDFNIGHVVVGKCVVDFLQSTLTGILACT